MWTAINQIANFVSDLWLWPLASLPSTWQICVTALPVTIFALLVFKYFSNQQGIEGAKDKIKAYLLELRLFKDDLGVSWRAQQQIFRYSLKYMGHALMPMAVMLVPLVLVIVQLETRYAYLGLKPGESTLLTVTLAEGKAVSETEVILSLPPGLAQETPPLRIEQSGEIHWRIRAVVPGNHKIGIRIGDTNATKRVVVGTEQVPLSPVIYRADDIRTLGYPAEPALDIAQPATAIHLTYPRGRSEFLGLSSATWILMGASLLFGYALRGLFGVTF